MNEVGIDYCNFIDEKKSITNKKNMEKFKLPVKANINEMVVVLNPEEKDGIIVWSVNKKKSKYYV